jgi:hypothetical protein
MKIPPVSVRSVCVRTAVLVLCIAGALPHAATAQSCILTRLNSPVLNAFNPIVGTETKWEVSFGWRWGRSFRHFVGTEEQKYRVEQGTEVVNLVNLADLGIRRNFTSQTSVEVGIPYLMATRSHAIRDDNDNVIGRSSESSRGLSDVSAVIDHLLWDPTQHTRSNLSLGVGIKFPTGQDNIVDTRLRYVDGEIVPSLQTNDESVQPGDGGFGLILQSSGYTLLNKAGTLAGYATVTYILEPEDTNGVYTYRRSPGEQIVSITDQYVARLGLQLGPQRWKGWSAGLGGRIEGVPAHDLLGSSNGFRRPGYMLSLEPSVTWSHGPYTTSLAVPYAIVRNRVRSVTDIRNGRHGDAAFPDLIALLNFDYRF